MPSFACPRCSTVVTVAVGQTPTCTRCGYGSVAPQVATAAWPAQQYPQPGYPPVYAQGRTDGMSVAALVLGCLGWLSLPGLIMAILAIIFGIQGINRCKRTPGLRGHGMAVAGVVLGSIFSAMWLLLIIFIGSLIGSLGGY